MTSLLDVFGGSFTLADRDPVELQIKYAMHDAGIEKAPGAVKIDGALHRFSTSDKPGDDAGWYVFYPGEPVAGAFGDWRTGDGGKFRENIGRELSIDERMAADEKQRRASAAREAENEKRREVIAGVIEKIWREAAQASPEHPYLTRKGVQPHGSRVTGDGRLIVPLFDPKSEKMISLQYIPTEKDEKKKFHGGVGSGGAIWSIGKPGDRVYVVEGFATGATVREKTGEAVVIAYSADNLPAACKAIRERHGKFIEIVIVADNDEGGKGEKLANVCRDQYGARVVLPPIIGDANDFVSNGGDLISLLEPGTDRWLVCADEFCAKPAPISWLVKRWVQANAMIMVHGPSGGGKTFAVLDMACHIASERDTWQGQIVHGCPVVYLAGEGHHGLKQRLAAWKQRHGHDLGRLWLSQAGVSLNQAAGYGKTIEAVSGLPERPGLIIVDTLHRHLEGDENSAQDTKTMLDACAGLMRRFDCSVLLVHHTGVNEEAQHRARGSSAWRGALDIEISVVPAKGDRPIQIVQRKSKDAEIAAPIWAQLEQVKIEGWIDEDGEQVTSAVLAAADAPEEQQKEAKWRTDLRVMQRAWENGAGSVVAGSPWVSREEVQTWIVKSGKSAGSARNFCSPNRQAGALVNAGAIVPLEVGGKPGWAIPGDSGAAWMLGS